MTNDEILEKSLNEKPVKSKKKIEKKEVKLKTFSFPTLGFSVQAKNKEEADIKMEEMKKKLEVK